MSQLESKHLQIGCDSMDSTRNIFEKKSSCYREILNKPQPL